MLLGIRVRALREKRNLTQADVDRRSGLSRSCLSRIETGQTVPTIETLAKIGNVLRVPLYQFFRGNVREASRRRI
jgi:transcriptional regulator with XRE-family HTH domain